MSKKHAIAKETIFWMLYTIVLYYLFWHTIEAFSLIFRTSTEIPYIILDILRPVLVVGIPAYFLNKSFHIIDTILQHPIITVILLIVLVKTEKICDAWYTNAISSLDWFSYAKEVYDLCTIALRYMIIAAVCYFSEPDNKSSQK